MSTRSNALGLCWIIVLGALALLITNAAKSLDPAPRSAQTTLSVDVSGQRSAGPTAAPRPQTGELRTTAQPSASTDSQFRGTATWYVARLTEKRP